MLNESALADFSSSFRGTIIRPGTARYDEARKVYNGMIDRKPAIMAQCVDVADVVAAVRLGREQGLPIAIRGGGLNAGGLGACDNGLVICLSRLRSTQLDLQEKTVRVGGGALLGDVEHASGMFGYAVPGGVISTTGVGGLTLGGGLGHLTRKHGLAIDNLLEAEVVLADGSVVRANARGHEDLFWALRGGGGNFGVVTSFLFRLHPLRSVYARPMLWPLDQAPVVMQWYAEYIATAPEDINGFFAFLTVPTGDPFPKSIQNTIMCGIVWCSTAEEDEARRLLMPARKLNPVFEFAGSMPLAAVQSMFDSLYPPGLLWYWRADFVNRLPEAAIEHHTRFARAMPSPLSMMHLYPVNGAAAKVNEQETAWSYRDATWAMVIAGIDPDPSNKKRIVTWAQEYYDAVHPFSAEGAYINFLMHDEGNTRVRAAYRNNYARLATSKKRYDPANLFRVNQNIVP